MERKSAFSGRTVEWLLVAAISVLLLYYGRTLFIPMFYGLFIAVVLYPVCRRLESRGFPKSLAITTGLLIVFLIFVVLIWLLIAQFNC